MFTVILVCARGGSKGIPRKNLQPLFGHPLIAYTIALAKSCDFADRVVVSTEDAEIADVGRRYGADVPFERPAEFARDDTAKAPVVQHATRATEEWLGHRVDLVIDLEVTAPLRETDDVRRCWDAVQKPDTDVALAVSLAIKNPYFNLVEVGADGYLEISKRLSRPVVTRQEAPAVYAIHGTAFAFERDYLLRDGRVLGGRARPVVVPPERGIDIDEPIDLLFVELLVRSGLARLPGIALPSQA